MKTGKWTNPVKITRDSISEGALIREVEKIQGYPLLTDEERQASVRQIMTDKPAPDIWLFAYGSLIWNPTFSFDRQCKGTLYGWQRTFCMWTYLRGTIDRPGLTLALDTGDACEGMLYRIPEAQCKEELNAIWRREMIDGAYQPCWVEVDTPDGKIKAVTFVINPSHSRYTGPLEEYEIIHTIATATGKIGPCCEYLFNTHASFKKNNITDSSVDKLDQQVRSYQAQLNKNAFLSDINYPIAKATDNQSTR